MLGIGLDVGTGFVKIVSDNNTSIFPSLYAYKDPSQWDTIQNRIIAVGVEAQELQKFPDAVVLRPVQEGKPINDLAFCELISYAIKKIRPNSQDSIHEVQQDLKLVVGLPYGAKSEKVRLEKLIRETIKPKALVVVPQAIGTIINQNKSSGIVLSIGQGTSELVAFEDSRPVGGQSIPQASDFITQEIGEFSHLDFDIYAKYPDLIKEGVEKLADILANRAISFKTRIGNNYEIIVSGGGILIPGMQKALSKKLKGYVIPADPIMSNALGLYKLTFDLQC